MIAARRERVLDAAEVVLAEVGVTATMDEIAEAAGIGRRTLFRYFPSREDLIAAAIERRYQRLDREVFDTADSSSCCTPTDWPAPAVATVNTWEFTTVTGSRSWITSAATAAGSSTPGPGPSSRGRTAAPGRSC